MSAPLLNVHQAYITAHLKYLTQNRGISTPGDYFTNSLDFTDIAPEYHEYPLNLIYRVFSLNPADIMIVLKNPNVTQD